MARTGRVRSILREGGSAVIEAVMLWNEPNNLSHWDFELDADWKIFAAMARAASQAIAAENPRLTRVLGGISPIDPAFLRKRKQVRFLSSGQIAPILPGGRQMTCRLRRKKTG